MMSNTYLGWDGNPYPWPPPEGWYQAADGRWWAPGTGPTADPVSQDSSSEPGAMNLHSMGVQATTLADPSAGFSATPPQGPVDQPTQALQGASVTPPQGYSPTGQPTNGNMMPSGAAPLFQPNPSDPTIVPFQQQQPQSESQKGLIFAAGVGVLALLSGLAFIVLGLIGDDSDDLLDDQSDSIATEDSTGTTLPLQSTTSTLSDVDTTAFSETTETSSTVADDTASTDDSTSTSIVEDSTTTPPSSTTTTVPSTTADTTPSSSTTTTSAVVVDQQKVASFRSDLQAQNIGTDNLTDVQIQRFADRICEVAAVSNADAFENFRAEQVASRPDQDPAALRSTINAAASTFCPAEATRLGIS